LGYAALWPPALHECEGGGPPARLPEFGVAFLSKLLQLVDRDYGEQPLFQGGGKLEGQPQVGMSRRKRQDLGSDVPFDIEAAEQVEQLAADVSPPDCAKRLPDELDQAVQRTDRRVEIPRAHIPLLQRHRAARPEELDVVGVRLAGFA